MEQKKKCMQTIRLAVVAAFAAVAFALCACAPSGEGGGTSDDAATQSANAQPGSMMAVHTPKQIEAMNGDYSKKNCLSCHPRDSIVAANDAYGGLEGVNPHASHAESYDCTRCHSIEGTSVLVCNTACHGGYHNDGNGFPLPAEGWMDPTDDMPSADGTPVK